MNWFDPSDDVAILPGPDRARFWVPAYGSANIPMAPQALFVNNGHGKLFDAVCAELDELGTAHRDHRARGYAHFHLPSGGEITAYRAPEPAPYAATNLEWIISAGATQIVFVNGAGSLREDLPVGSLVLPDELIREEGTSYHYVPSGVILRTDATLNARMRQVAGSLGITLLEGKAWTTDAIYRETLSKVARLRDQGAIVVDMELSALVGVAHFRKRFLSALLVVTDVVSPSHTWDGIKDDAFRAGVGQAAALAARLFFH